MRNSLPSLLGGVASAALALAPCQAYAVLTPAHHGKATARILPNFASCDFSTPTTFAHTWYIDPVNGQSRTP